MKRCGNCRFGEHASESQTTCHGAPPSVINVAQGEGGSITVHSQQPVMPHSYRGCGLWRWRWQFWKNR